MNLGLIKNREELKTNMQKKWSSNNRSNSMWWQAQSLFLHLIPLNTFMVIDNAGFHDIIHWSAGMTIGKSLRDRARKMNWIALWQCQSQTAVSLQWHRQSDTQWMAEYNNGKGTKKHHQMRWLFERSSSTNVTTEWIKRNFVRFGWILLICSLEEIWAEFTSHAKKKNQNVSSKFSN